MHKDRQEFARHLRMLMAKKRLTQDELAVAVGCSRQSINNYLNEKRIPDIIIAARMASVLGVSCDELLGLHSMTNAP